MLALYRSFGIPLDPEALILLLGLTLARSIPVLFLNPFLGGSAVPSTVKIGTALALTVLLFPALMAAPGPIAGGPPYAFLFAKEIAIGITLGFVSSLVFWAFATAGRLIDTQRGANMAETMVYQLRERTSFFGQMFLQASTVVFLLLGGHQLFLHGYYHSFVVLPVWSFPNLPADPMPLALDMARLSADVFVIALQLGAPAVVAIFLTDMGFGLLNRASPQINVYTLSMPVKMALGLIMTLATLRLIFERFGVHAGGMIDAFNRFIAYLGR
jgi:flagellar biosynthetic protein FliR